MPLLRKQFSLPNLLIEGQRCVASRLAQPPPLHISPNRPDHAGNQANQETGAKGSLGSLLEEPTLVVRADSPATRSHLSSEQDNMAAMAQAVGSAPMATPNWIPYNKRWGKIGENMALNHTFISNLYFVLKLFCLFFPLKC